MCGVTGLFSIGAAHKIDLKIRQMSDTLSHRGPDGDGFWSDTSKGVALGHNRLAILDLSEAGKQPMHSPSGRYIMSYNGEIYNTLEIRRDLETKACKFRGHSDTEVLLCAFEVYGIKETLSKITGMFAIILWDQQTQTVTLIRDFLGKKPLYIGWAGTDLLVSSELKAFQTHPDFKSDVNPDHLALYFQYACVPAPYSIYKDVWKIQSGSLMTLDLKTLKPHTNILPFMETYWDATEIIRERSEQRRTHTLDDSSTIKEFETLLSQCVSERMVSDVPLGAFLSGGIDSSAMVALMQKQSASPIKTFSIGFDVKEFNEAEFAKDIALHLGTEHHELYLSSQDALNVIPSLPHIYDEPFADISQIPTYLVSKFAQEHVTVALSGDGGDEMLGGYRRHFMIPPIWKKIQYCPYPLRKTFSQIIERFGSERWSRIGAGRHPHLADSMEKFSGLLRQKNNDDVYDYLLGLWENPYHIVPGAKQIPLPFKDKHLEGLSFSEEMMMRDSLFYLPNDILQKVDRASMAVSLEARAPLLDRRIYEYVWTLQNILRSEMEKENGS